MIEIWVWLATLFAAGAAQLMNRDYASKTGGLNYILVGISILLGLYFNFDTLLLAKVLGFLSTWWILEMFIFLNIITGYSFYARARRNT